MKNKLAIVLLSCIFLFSCNIPRYDDIETPSNNSQSTDTVTTGQVEIETSTITPQILTETFTPMNFTETPTETMDITKTSEPGFGSITGNISGYPYGSIPQLVLVAHEQKPPYHYWYVINTPGSSYYSMDGFVSSGKYMIVAYDPSGHTGGCVNIIEVKKDESITCDITNWGSGYPAKPAGVP